MMTTPSSGAKRPALRRLRGSAAALDSRRPAITARITPIVLARLPGRPVDGLRNLPGPPQLR